MERDRQMDLIRTEKTIHKVVNELCRPESYELVYQKPAQDKVMPSLDALTEFVEHLRTVLFPAYFSDSEMSLESMPYILGNHLEKAERLLSEQIKRGYGFSCEITYWQACMECEEKSRNLSREFIAAIPGIRKLLATDVMAAYEGDPAARSIGETIFSYPSIKAMTNYRIAHELHRLGVEIIPRIITEMAHSQTGIDIHPGAVIGERFFIDHGSGTVIGETCEIGNNVRLYQGVTLGAVSFPKDESGRLVKGIPRHPIVEDDVIIYSGTTILGRVRIGKGSVIGGNVWLTSDVPPYTRVTQDKHAQSVVMISGSERE
ncbi:MAG: Serine acetyltransferase [Deltaproteobacteria bacterium ADurb.BinA179]|jgi:serine O-acetyltransferase|nr:serine acetyltransferase [Pseudomonadota bacterium]OPZ30073.1 MAG: Serine acetyltransferase [Deltaproteobacteria bacterium ADurb.BinA179]HNR50375.1 serine acetyltransferase [Deltaproteobacteria bacterium]HRR20020.1 serine acetyltransferase [Desulfomonilia bacterium]HNU73361.1 serine acetyltransferase [Deltaproteobacteria bacterium]